MKAIIIPLQEYLFNYEKYDGLSNAERFRKKNKRFVKFMQGLAEKKFGMLLIKIFFVAPVFIVIVLFYVFPIYLFYLIKTFSHKKAVEKITLACELLPTKMNNYNNKRKFGVKREFDKYHKKEISFFVYYNKGMIPLNGREKGLFYEKLNNMKNELNIKTVFEANNVNDIESIISIHKINPLESFFISDGIIDLKGFLRLNEK